MEQSLSEAKKSRNSLSLKKHYRVHKSLPLNHIQSTSHFCKIHFRVILPSTPRFSKWSRSFRVPNYMLNAFFVRHECFMFRLSDPTWFYDPNNIRWIVKVIKFLIMQFFSLLLLLFLCPNILLTTRSTNTVNLCSSFRVREGDDI
jgi:hypothetical protein